MKALKIFVACAVVGGFVFAGCGKEKKPGPSLETYHEIHVNELNISCSVCHAGEKYPEGEFVLDKYKLERKVALGQIPGVVDRYVCIGCHREGSMGPEWYGSR